MSKQALRQIPLILLVITIPFGRIYNINTYAIGLFLITSLFWTNQSISKFRNGLIFLLLAYLILIVVNVLTISQSNGWATLLKYLPLIAIPFGLRSISYSRQHVLESYLYTIVVSCIICVVYTIIVSRGYVFYYHEPTQIIDIQSNYLGVLACFALAIIYTDILNTKVVNLRNGIFGILLFFSLAVFFNRTSIIIAFFITAVFIVSYIVKFGRNKIVLALLVFFAISSIWTLNRPIVKTKFKELIETDYSAVNVSTNGVSSRLLSWTCGVELLGNMGVFGYGIKNSNQELRRCYQDKTGTKSTAFLKTYNSHNQFLQTSLDLGYLGLIVLLLIYSYILYIGIKYRDVLILFYFITIFLFGMTEVFLYRQWGLIYFAFFTPFLLDRYIYQERASL